jgi:hypothetical protein
MSWIGLSKLPTTPYESRASRYFRPYTPSLAVLAGRALRRIKDGMDLAAQTGRVYHIWFHPEDFGCYPNENLALFSEVIEHFRQLREEYGMSSLSMTGLVDASIPVSDDQSLSFSRALSA